jgi:hypothetical protein
MNATEHRPNPAPPPRKITDSHKALIALLAFLVLAKLVAMGVHIPFQNAGQRALFGWKSIIFFMALALLGTGFAHIVGFPGMWEKEVSDRNRIWLPLAIGVVLGTALLAFDRGIGFAQLYAKAAGTVMSTPPFPYSALFQVFAGVGAAILYNLFSLAFTVWFFGTLLLARKWPSGTFWTMALVVSLWEPLTMASQRHWALFRLGPLSAGIMAILALIYVMDLVSVVLLRRFGFVATLVLRVSAVAVWHIIGGA